jgi:Fe-S-cluster containining protein
MMNLREAVQAAAERADVRAAVDGVYSALEAATRLRQPVCIVSGRCCRFEEYGHRLYVTTLELARFVADLRVEPSPDWDGKGCPFQKAKLCGVHAIRPFGCRIFFCDASSTEWQHEQYERLHARLRALHDELDVPYFYVEWRHALGEMGLADIGPAEGSGVRVQGSGNANLGHSLRHEP